MLCFDGAQRACLDLSFGHEEEGSIHHLCGSAAHTHTHAHNARHSRTHARTHPRRMRAQSRTHLRAYARTRATAAQEARRQPTAALPRTRTHARTHKHAHTHARTPRHATPPPTSAKEVDTSLQGGGGGEGGGGEGDRCAGEGVRRGCVMHTQKSTCVCNVLHVTHLDGQADNFDQIGRQWWGWRKSLLHLRL